MLEPRDEAFDASVYGRRVRALKVLMEPSLPGNIGEQMSMAIYEVMLEFKRANGPTALSRDLDGAFDKLALSLGKPAN